jgi:copper(I)-binding protein
MGSLIFRTTCAALAVAALGSISMGSAWAQMDMSSGSMSKGNMTGMTKSAAPKADAADTGPSYQTGNIVVQTPWTRATPGGARIAGGYMTIKNTGSETDHLVSITTDVAGKSEMHQMSMNNGVMTMRPIDGPLEIAPGATVKFDPSGYHVMFEGLKQALKVGDQVKATLQFEKAGALDVNFAVGPIGATVPPSALPHS